MKNAKGKIVIRSLSYAAVFAIIVAIMFFGSQKISQTEEASGAALTDFNNRSLALTADKVSESYIVADVADSILLPSSDINSANYITVSTKYQIFGSSTNVGDDGNTVQEKPTIMDSGEVSRGVITHTVKEGETLDSIIASHRVNISKDQVRWSNGMKTEEVTPGATIYLPSRPGIVYRVKDGDSVGDLASKYGSKVEEIVTYNDLEGSGLKSGMLIILPNGVPPETERPEYVAPTSSSRSSSRSRSGRRYTYASGYGNRHNMFEIEIYGYWRNMYNSTRGDGNRNGFGQCTWYAWWWRRYKMPSNYWLPNAILGNANAWYYRLSGMGYAVGNTPQYGAVFQTTVGYYGHVGVVVGVNPGTSITVQEMNYAGPNGKLNHVYESTISWSDAFNFNYIYGRK